MVAFWITVGGCVAAALVGIGIWAALKPYLAERRRAANDRARRSFHLQRERLECVFFQASSHSGKPRGLRWMDCDFEDAVTYACNRQNGKLSALVGCTIRFEAIEGGGMEHVAAVTNLRAATAVFEFDGKLWHTQGRVIYNLNPVEAIEHFRDQLVMVGQELAGRAG